MNSIFGQNFSNVKHSNLKAHLSLFCSIYMYIEHFKCCQNCFLNINFPNLTKNVGNLPILRDLDTVHVPKKSINDCYQFKMMKRYVAYS